MDIFLIEAETEQERPAKISKVVRKELPLKKDGWKFNWKSLFKTEGADFYKISLVETPHNIEGMLMITIFNEEMVFMNNIEIAPHNIGSQGLYKNVAGCLIAYACKESFERGIGNYNGFLSFESKTELIELYHRKYGAQLAMGHKMFIDPQVGKMLIKKYLNIQ